jgi:hypothetical protein
MIHLIVRYKLGPIDSFEIHRNDVIYSCQHNRNPFIDHPEYVSKIWTITGTSFLKEREIKVYPNPVKDYLHVVLPDNAEANGVLYSMTGNKVAEFSGKGKITVQTLNVDSGCYGVRIVYNNKVYQSKIIIQN